MGASVASYGLLGGRLGHSWSPKIHARLGSTPYALLERDPAGAEELLRHGDWVGLNVTIPYKRLAAQLADHRSPRVEALGVANTLVRREDGSVFAENTDVPGFRWMLERFCERALGATAGEVLGRAEVLVLGSGGAAQAVRAALLEAAPCSPILVSRGDEGAYERLAERHPHARLVVNATPVGMFPSCPASPLEEATLAVLEELVAVLDVVYNPERTGICLAAERLGLPCESGLAMLVAQAFHASELFQGRELPDSLIGQVVGELRAAQRNVVLIGMPGAGKTSAGRALARLLRRPFIDLDDAFALDAGMGVADYIGLHGEAAFRERETAIAASYGAQSGLVIACGGGIVTQACNYDLLHQNGTIVQLDRPLDQLSSDGRPLSQARGVTALAQERMGLYRSWSDLCIPCTGSSAGDAALIRERLGL